MSLSTGEGGIEQDLSLEGARVGGTAQKLFQADDRTDDDFVRRRRCCFLPLHFSHFLPPAQNEINASSALLCVPFSLFTFFFATKEGIFHTRFLPSTPHSSQSHVKGLWGEGGEEKGSDFFCRRPLPPRPSASAPPPSPFPVHTQSKAPPNQPTPSFSLRRIRFLLLHLGAPDAKAFSRRVIHPPSGSRLVRLS